MPYRNGKSVDWKVKVRGIKALLTDDNSDENAIKVGKDIYKILNLKHWRKYFGNFEYLGEFNYILGVEDFNSILSDLYDYADDNLIWIG